MYEWWLQAPYAILAPAGEAFDVLTVPTELAATAVVGTPTLLGPDGAGLLVTSDARLRPDLATYDVELLAAGALVALPPTRLPEGIVTWHVAPVDTAWQPGDAEVV